MKIGRNMIALIAAVALAVGCTSTQQPGHTLSGSSDGMLVGTDGASYEFWEDWTPAPPMEMNVDDVLRPATLFDAWKIDDDSFREPLFDATFHVLTTLDTGIGDDDISQILRSLLLRLDPAQPKRSVHWELLFISQADGDAEGLVLRIVGADGATLWIEATRRAGGTTSPSQWIVYADPAAEQFDALSARWTETDQGWTLSAASGGESISTDQAMGADWDRLLDLWEVALWDRVTDRQYLEPDFAFDDQQRALGKDVVDRELSDFVTDTVFWPRGEIEFGQE